MTVGGPGEPLGVPLDQGDPSVPPPHFVASAGGRPAGRFDAAAMPSGLAEPAGADATLER